MSEVFLARKKHYQCHPGSPAENGDRSLICLTVYLDAKPLKFSSYSISQNRQDPVPVRSLVLYFSLVGGGGGRGEKRGGTKNFGWGWVREV
jgi:hypothetical protein